VIVKELEREGIPTAHICVMTSIAVMVGSNRVIPGFSILHPVGKPDLDSESEKALRRAIVDKALKALQTDITEQIVFSNSV